MAAAEISPRCVTTSGALPPREAKPSAHRLERKTFVTSRELEFVSKKELATQTGHDPEDWPLVCLKEPVDNSLDACEERGVAPVVSVVVNERGITITDNGPGIPPEVVERVVDFSTRVSSREAYASPTRGAQGNALKTLIAMPFVLSDGERGETEIVSHGLRHRIPVAVDHIRQKPYASPERTEDTSVQIGARLTIQWPDLARSLLDDAKTRFVRLAEDYAFLNPHLTIDVEWDNSRAAFAATKPEWPKWGPHTPLCPRCYSPELFERFLAAELSHGESGGHMPVRDMLVQFRDLKRNDKRARVMEAAGLPGRTTLLDLVKNGGRDFDRAAVRRLLKAMQGETKRALKPKTIGVIGERHVRTRFEAAGCEMEHFRYAKVECPGDVPAVIEAAFAPHPSAFEDGIGYPRRLITGINWSAGITNPFRKLGDRSLDGLLTEQEAPPFESVFVFLHVACPRVQYGDRGKSSAVVGASGDGHSKEIIAAVTSVTKEWAKHKKKLERQQQHSRAELARAMKRQKNAKVDIIDAAFAVMKDAYLEASDNGELPARARQIYYKARGPILAATGEDRLGSNYFTQKLLPRYMRAHEDETATWKVDYDPRGKLIEPHTGRSVPMGTQDVDRILAEITAAAETSDADATAFEVPNVSSAFPTVGPRDRYRAILFCEKEGFNDLFEHVRLAERYDIALMSTKGMSVTAARHFIDRLQTISRIPVPVFVLHDLDKSGLSIYATLQRSTERYQFTNRVPVIDFGVRMDDVRRYKLESEDVVYKKSDPRPNMRMNGADDEEIELLCQEPYGKGWRGERVELNAFASRPLIDSIEAKLKKHGVMKVIPDKPTLRAAWQRTAAIEYVNQRLPELAREAEKHAETQAMPRDVTARLRRYLDLHREVPWDVALAAIVRGEE